MGFLLATIIMSFIWKIDRARSLLTFSSLAMLLSLASIVVLHSSIRVVLALLFLTGLSEGILHIGLDSLFSEIYHMNRVKYLNVLHVFFGLGAFIGPLLVGTVLTYTTQWYIVYLLIGLFSIPLPIFFWRRKLYKNVTLFEKPQVATKAPIKKAVT